MTTIPLWNVARNNIVLEILVNPTWSDISESLTLKVPEKLQLYGLYVHYVVHICDFGMLRVNHNSWLDF